MAEIYALIDPRSGDVRYIGKANDSGKRLKSHIRDSRRRTTPVYWWIRSLAKSKLEPDVLVLSQCEDWEAEERRLIASARSRGVRLLNLADGGDQPFCPTEVLSRNAKAQNDARAADPFKFASHAFLRRSGQVLVEMKKLGIDQARRENFAAALDRCRLLGQELLGLRLAANPRTRHYFPEHVRPLIAEVFDG
jgi:hypothetical protein